MRTEFSFTLNWRKFLPDWKDKCIVQNDVDRDSEKKKLYIAKDLTADIVVIGVELCKSLHMHIPM